MEELRADPVTLEKLAPALVESSSRSGLYTFKNTMIRNVV
jgi:hypothetical protein